jgi:hypothetical protein
LACASVTTAALNITGLVVTAATDTAASATTGTSASFPAHCDVTGKINQRTGIDGKSYAIGYKLLLGKFSKC